MATAEFSKFAGILSAALSQHHLSGFEYFYIRVRLGIKPRAPTLEADTLTSEPPGKPIEELYRKDLHDQITRMV